MSQIYALKSPPLPHDQALFLMELLDNAYHPEAVAVSMDETDEEAGEWVVSGYYTEPFEFSVLVPLMQDWADDAAGLVAAMSLAPVEERNWVAASLEGLAPVRAGRFYVYGGHDRHRRPGFGVNIELEAGVAFGTGHHATTQGCLLALDRLLKMRPLDRVLDVGCGTGILGIAAARVARCPVVMGDNDPLAVHAARANAKSNGVGSYVQVCEANGASHANIQASAPYDLVFANILARPLVKLAPDLVGVCAHGGALVLSGLYATQERQVLAAYRNAGAVLHKRIRIGQWSTLWLTRYSCH